MGPLCSARLSASLRRRSLLARCTSSLSLTPAFPIVCFTIWARSSAVRFAVPGKILAPPQSGARNGPAKFAAARPPSLLAGPSGLRLDGGACRTAREIHTRLVEQCHYDEQAPPAYHA